MKSEASFRLLLQSFFSVFCIAWPGTALSGYQIPTDPFFKQYEIATGIFAGELIEIEEFKGNGIPSVFSKNGLKEIKKATLKVLKSWKGKSTDTISFLAYSPKSFPSGPLKASLMSGPYKKGLKYLVFLREEDGSAFVQKRSGFVVFFEEEAYERSKLIRALDALSAGRTMSEATALISEYEKTRYEKFGTK